jgi:hypothetical protein
MNLSYHVGDDPSNVRRNRELFFGQLDIESNELAEPEQVQGDTVRMADVPGRYTQCDALFTDRQRVFLCVSTADCLPVFLFDPRKKVVAAIHAGWRGTRRQILLQAVLRLVEMYGCDPADIVAYIGPGAGVCCYTVGDDVASKFDERYVKNVQEKVFLDLKHANAEQLVAGGVRAQHIETSPYCTICNADLFHSFRRDGSKSGRMMGVIGLLSLTE